MVFEDGCHFAALIQGRIATARLRRQVRIAVEYIAVMFTFAGDCRSECVRSCGRRIGRGDSVLCARGVGH